MMGYVRENGMTRTGRPPATVDDLMVQRFRQVGAIVIGTTTMTEFGRCPLGYNSHDQGPFNPYSSHDSKHYPGGSSSGSVVAVMMGLLPLAISFDGGGSIRLPAAMSGAFGLAPTYGRIPFDGAGAKSMGMIRGGVVSSTASDSALAYTILAQVESDHFYSKLFGGFGPPKPVLKDYAKINRFDGLRIGVFWEYLEDAQSEVVAACKATLDQLKQRGATIVDVSIPHLTMLRLAHGISISSDFSAINDHTYSNHPSGACDNDSTWIGQHFYWSRVSRRQSYARLGHGTLAKVIRYQDGHFCDTQLSHHRTPYSRGSTRMR